MIFDLVWPAVIVVFVGFVFFLVTRFIGLALRECEGEWRGKEMPFSPSVPPGTPA